jgi:hypothetical protein
MRLSSMPEDVKQIILEEQKHQKEKCQCLKNQEQVIYSLIRKAAKQDPTE